MDLSGLHILLTYTCNYECDHCFVWGSPWQSGTFTLAQLEDVFRQAKQVESLREIYFEGGEAFLYYPILVEAVGRAKKNGFTVGIVSNGYWATGAEDAWIWLQPLVAAGLDRLEISCDLLHGDSPEDGFRTEDRIHPGKGSENGNSENHPALTAAGELFLETGIISIDPPTGYRDPAESEPGVPLTGGSVMYRGRAAETLVGDLPRQSWTSFTACSYENLAEPGRVHLDAFGNLHLCQGVVIGNLFEQPLKEIVTQYDPESHPIVAPLLAGGPSQLVRQYDLPHESGYVDACHLCYSARQMLRSRFPAELGPDQMYGEY